MKTIFIFLVSLLSFTLQSQTQVYKLCELQESYIGQWVDDEFIYSAGFRNTLENLASKHGKKDYSVIYSNEAIILWAGEKCQEDVSEFLDKFKKNCEESASEKRTEKEKTKRKQRGSKENQNPTKESNQSPAERKQAPAEEINSEEPEAPAAPETPAPAENKAPNKTKATEETKSAEPKN